MKYKKNTRFLIGAGLLAAIILDTIVQLIWKQLASESTLDISHGIAPLVTSFIKNPLLMVVVILFIAQFINWLFLLGKTDLSFAYPITALSYVTVALSAQYFLGEQLSWAKIAGIGMIIIGVYFMSCTQHNSNDA